jgi:nucleotide-binding universal stress UspA family protein
MTKEVDGSDRVDTVVLRNLSAASSILSYVEEEEIDMVVMGTHGRSGLSRFFLGSVAEKVVRHAGCPVMTIGYGKRDYRSEPCYRKVLAAFDFSEISKDAVVRGYQFTRAYGAEMEVLYVVEQVIPPPLDDIWRASVQSEVPEVLASARASLKQSLGQEELDQVKLEVRVGDADGKAEAEIVNYAQEKKFDLVLMGTHGLSGIDHALLGSTTERVVRTAPCPVLTFHKRQE